MIEDVILAKDRRGISKLRNFLQENFCERASKYIIKKSQRVMILTGFYVKGHCETDGPLGALMLTKALRRLKSEVLLVSDDPCFGILKSFEEGVLEFPITSHEKSRRFAKELVKEEKPSLIISCERCGFSHDQRYYNARGEDITPFTAKLDYLFSFKETIGIGDFGNEIGMGNLSKKIENHLKIKPCITRCRHLVIASTSNWGCYGLISYLSILSSKNLLPSSREEEEMLELLVQRGAVDGFSGLPETKVDGFSPDALREILEELQSLVEEKI
ncbi:MAG: DUF4392 domain-containing protein [Candidatus Methanofastidiosia archaeon]